MPEEREGPVEERIPNIVTSGISRHVTKDGITMELCIYRLEEVPHWTMEVVHGTGTSIVWDETFSSDDAANKESLKTVAEEGMATFLDSAKIIRFQRAPDDGPAQHYRASSDKPSHLSSTDDAQHKGRPDEEH